MAWTIASKIVRRVVMIDESHSVLEAAALMAEMKDMMTLHVKG